MTVVISFGLIDEWQPVAGTIMTWRASRDSYFSNGRDIRELVEAQTPGPFNWDCFTFGTIELEDKFIVYLAVDHLNSDGIGATQTSFDEGKTMSEVSLHRVMELVPDDSSIDICQGWSVPMISYLDVRKLPGGDIFDEVDFSAFGNRGGSEEVFIWINRFAGGTTMSILYPMTDAADKTIRIYADRMVEIFATIAETVDYAPPEQRSAA